VGGGLALVSSRLRFTERDPPIICDVLGRSLGTTLRRLNQPIELGSGARGLVGGARGRGGTGRAPVGSSRRSVRAHAVGRFPGADISRRRDVARLAAGSGEAEF
jgi:hypothetical protein